MLCRPTVAAVVLCTAAYLLCADRRRRAAFVLGGVPFLVFLTAYNYHYFGHPFAFGGGAERGTEPHRAFEDRVRPPVAELLVGESARPVVQPGTGSDLVLSRAGARPSQRGGGVARPALPSPDPVVPLQLGTVLLILVAGKWFDWWGGVTWAYRSIISSRYRMLTRLSKIQFSEAILQSVSHRCHRCRGYSSGQ